MTDAVGNGERHAGYYQALQSAYNDQLQRVKNLIELDVKRTGAGKAPNRYKEAMFRILFAYAKRNMKLGYCQGLNSVVYFLLRTGLGEERVFWMLSYILEQLTPKGYYTNMVAVLADISLFKHFLSVVRPQLVLHFRRYGFDLNYFLVPWFVTLFTNLDNNELKTAVFDRFIAEGSITLFRAALVIFIAMERELLGIFAFDGFIKAVQSRVKELKDVDRFREQMNEIYINDDIIERLRNTLLRKEEGRASLQRLKSKPIEICNEMTPYCFVSDEVTQNHGADFVVKVNNVTENIKANYFNPFYGKKLADKFNKLSLPPLVTKLTNERRRYSMADPRDYIIKEEKRVVHSPTRHRKISNVINESLLRPQNDNTRLSEALDKVLDDDVVYSYDYTVEIEPGKKAVDEQILFNRGSSLSGLSSYRNIKEQAKQLPITMETECYDLLCSRTKHYCELVELNSDHRQLLARTKQIFFDKVNASVANYLGSKITAYITSLPYRTLQPGKGARSPHKARALDIKPTFKLKQTSFDAKRPKRFLSLHLKRPKHFETRSKKRATQLFSMPKRPSLLMSMSMQHKPEPYVQLDQPDSKVIEEDFFKTFEKRYKFSMNNYLDVNSPLIQPEKVHRLDQLI